MPVHGFTAVNGLDQNQAQGAMSGPTTEPSTSSQVAHKSDGVRDGEQTARPSESRNDSVICPEPSFKQSPETAKRKRSIADTIEQPSNENFPTTSLPCKRRMTDTDAIVHSMTPDEPSAGLRTEERRRVTLELANRDRCSREQSPVPTHNQRAAPPQVRPETHAHLAESLATHLQDAYKSNPPKAPEVATTTSQAGSPGKVYSPGEDAGDQNGKRKRNFSNRTKTGCHTCRQRKKKCDEAKPECKNCTRGGHTCTGYGPKPLNYKGPNVSRTHVPLQSKAQDAPRRSPSPEEEPGPRYTHWGRIPPAPSLQEHHHRLPSSGSPHDEIRRSSRDGYPSQSWQHRPDSATSHPYGTMPPVGQNHALPPPVAFYPGHPYSPPYEHWPHPFPPPYRPNPGPPLTVSSRESGSTHSSGNASHYHFPSGQVSEHEKMILGQPYLAWRDETLLDDRKQCKLAIERFNQASLHATATSPEERTRLFTAILDPAKRADTKWDSRPSLPPMAPTFNRPSRIGHRVVIEAPFKCDYGYNIEIGDDVVIEANCYMKDPCEIIIGHRVHIGEGVRLIGSYRPRDPPEKKGSQGYLVGGSIIIEDDVDIGDGAQIMAHRKIGRGASIAPGALVTKVCPCLVLMFRLFDDSLTYDIERPILHRSGGQSRAHRALPPAPGQGER